MRSFISTMALAFLISGTLNSTVLGAVRFVNLTKENIYLASYAYQPFSTKPVPKNTPPMVNEEGWWYSGWTVIAPGTAHEVLAGQYYLMNANGSITWENLETSKGLIKPGGSFRVFVSKANFNADFNKLLAAGYREVQYQKFDNSDFTWGTDFRYESKNFAFSFGSGARKDHKKNFSVPGRILFYDVSVAENKGGTFRWSKDTNHVTVSGTTEGQPQGFRARLPSSYRGTVTLHYLKE